MIPSGSILRDPKMASCGMAPDRYGYSGSTRHGKGAGAVIHSDEIWEDMQILVVHFPNPEILSKWKLTTDEILEWADSWNKKGTVMIFKAGENSYEADIRVEFSEIKGSWSMLGMHARKVEDPQPTMVLNLNCDAFPTKKEQRSQVIHEFGHALGLGHEHQRSDFWETVEKHINLERMKEDDRVGNDITKIGKASFGNDCFTADKFPEVIKKFLKVKDVGTASDSYDPDSIMHYGFDKMWLENLDYHNPDNVRRSSDLSEKEKAYILGIHKRSSGLPENPSETDFSELCKAYRVKLK